MTRANRLVCLLTSAVTACVAQSVPIAGPMTGWVYDPPSRSLRAISGIPGAARLGGAVVDGISWGSVAPWRTAFVTSSLASSSTTCWSEASW